MILSWKINILLKDQVLHNKQNRNVVNMKINKFNRENSECQINTQQVKVKNNWKRLVHSNCVAVCVRGNCVWMVVLNILRRNFRFVEWIKHKQCKIRWMQWILLYTFRLINLFYQSSPKTEKKFMKKGIFICFIREIFGINVKILKNLI